MESQQALRYHREDDNKNIAAYSRRIDFLHCVVMAAKTTVFTDPDCDNHPRVQNDVHVLSVYRQFHTASETAFCCH